MSVTDHIRRELLGEFRQSARDRLERIAATWMAIEADPSTRDSQAPLLLRELHTLKGEAKLMGFGQVCQLAHRTEDAVLSARTRNFVASEAIGELVLRAVDALGRMVEVEADTTVVADLDALGAALEAASAASAPVTAAGPATAAVPEPAPARSTPPSPMNPPQAQAAERDGFVRIDVAAAHLLAEGAGELLLAHQRYLRLAAELRVVADQLTAETAAISHRLGRTTLAELAPRLDDLIAQLGDEVYRGDTFARAVELDARRLRLVPLAPRLRLHLRAVRDLARELGKKAIVQVHDGGIAVDRDVVERLGEPLLHLLRNAVDHGIEAPAARAAGGKPESGRITITAERAGSHVLIIVEDDGAGIDADGVRRRAAELGVPGDTTHDDDALAVLFTPGFSTRHRVTETSGRGVGLDVVKRQVEALGGSVRVASRPGHGTRFELRIPVSVAMTRALAVVEQGQAFVFPHAAVEAVLAAAPGDIELVHTRRTLGLRDGRIPVVDLASILRLPPAPAAVAGGDLHAVVLRHEGHRVAVLVERWRGDTEVVIKPLGALAPSRLAIGACTLDGGELAVVLSPAEVIARALGEVPRVRAAARAPHAAVDRRILVVEDSAITRTMIGRFLRMLGYQVSEAADGAHALRVLDDAVVDLIITDIEMPELDGIELLQRLRADSRWRTTPVIVLTTRGSEQDKRRAVAAGADAYLIKTEFSEASLREALARHLGAA